MNDQHQEYVDAAGHDTRGPGAVHRAKISADALRAAAADDAVCPEPNCRSLVCKSANETTATWLRDRADQLLNEVGIPRCTATSIQGYTCLHPTNHPGPHEARPTVIRWTNQEPA